MQASGLWGAAFTSGYCERVYGLTGTASQRVYGLTVTAPPLPSGELAVASVCRVRAEHASARVYFTRARAVDNAKRKV